MIKKDDGEQMIICDDCGCEEYGGVLDFHEFLADMKSQGWRVHRIEDRGNVTYEHTCPTCSEGT